jgi:hypothetical protein
MDALRVAGTNRPGRRMAVLAVLVSAVMALGGQAAAVASHPGGVRGLRAGPAQAGVMATAAGAPARPEEPGLSSLAHAGFRMRAGWSMSRTVPPWAR